MNCTCFQRKYPCPIHKDRHLREVAQFEDTLYVIKIHGIWVEAHTLKYCSTVSKDAIRVFTSTIKDTKEEALHESTVFLG